MTTKYRLLKVGEKVREGDQLKTYGLGWRNMLATEIRRINQAGGVSRYDKGFFRRPIATKRKT